MDAHTLNAWTRFALQKGGIGTCTALVDNPATDAEDLMFMTGEKIIVLRRLDKDDNAPSSSSRRKSSSDEDSWFLGYCEGVVGRFKGSHVQIHGKLKKPVLMRRSGQGQIRESSTRFMSQAAAASLPASQVPAGIPVTAVDSEGEESEGRKSRKAESEFVADASRRASAATSDQPPGTQWPGNATTQLNAKNALASVPPIKGSHRSPAAADSADGSDSDDSETLLPWARPSSSTTSDDSADGKARSAPEASSVRLNGANGRSPAHQRDDGSSSRGSASKSTGSHMPNSPSQDSTLSSSTDDSEDEPNSNRRDHTLSIYDVYGRDSVAFPNFNLRHLSKGLNSESMASLALESANHPTPGIPDSFKESPRDPRTVPAREIAAKLKTSPSGRRPSAAPDPRAPPNQGVPAMASNLRQQVEAAAPQPPAPTLGPPNQASAPVGNFDPRRRPVGPPMPNGVPPPPGQLRIPSASSAAGSMSPSPTSPMAPQGIPRPGQPMPQGFGPGSSMPPPPMMSPDGSSPGSFPTPTGSHFPPGVQNAVFKPVRSSSDRSSERERISSGQLRKNPSNPSPGSFGGGPPSLRGSGISALSPPTTVSGSRSPSPLAASSSPGATLAGLPSPSAPSRTASPAPSNMSGRRPGPPGPSGPVAYDAKGFVLGPGLPCRSDSDDREKIDKWHAILAENDLVAARKSRKVRKMVQAGIPNAVRGKVWMFLANASVRRRAGLFEQLCKTSQEPKGKRGKEVLYEAIEKDVSRTYPDNKLFQDGSPGKADLEAILKAYVHYNPIIGYTQGMGLLVGMFLLHMPAEDAFWLLCALLRDIHMEGYYSNEMKQMHIDGVIFGQLLQSMDPQLASKLQSLGVEPIHFTPSWLLPLFARVVPWPTLLRLWDIFFYEGPNWILQVALAVVRIIREPLMATAGLTAKEDCMMLLLHPPPRELTPDNVVTCALSVKLKDGEMRKLSRNASKLVRDSTGARGRAPAGGAKSDGVARSTSVPARR